MCMYFEAALLYFFFHSLQHNVNLAHQMECPPNYLLYPSGKRPVETWKVIGRTLYHAQLEGTLLVSGGDVSCMRLPCD